MRCDKCFRFRFRIRFRYAFCLLIGAVRRCVCDILHGFSRHWLMRSLQQILMITFLLFGLSEFNEAVRTIPLVDDLLAKI